MGRFGFAPLLAIDAPKSIIEISKSEKLEVEFSEKIASESISREEVEEIKEYSKKVIDDIGVSGAKISVISRPPRHCGFGSTTQLTLALGTGISQVYDVKMDLQHLLSVLDRTTIGGAYVFRDGGFVLAGGFDRPKKGFSAMPDESYRIPPIFFNKEFPEEWRFVIAWPEEASRGLSGNEEKKAFTEIQKLEPPKDLIHEAHFVINTGLVPAILEKKPVKFGKALTRIQNLAGRIYRPIQETTYNPASEDIIERLEKMDESLGVGQSSWGPAVYSFIRNEEKARKVADEMRSDEEIKVSIVKADNKGRQIEQID